MELMKMLMHWAGDLYWIATVVNNYDILHDRTHTNKRNNFTAPEFQLFGGQTVINTRFVNHSCCIIITELAKYPFIPCEGNLVSQCTPSESI